MGDIEKRLRLLKATSILLNTGLVQKRIQDKILERMEKFAELIQQGKASEIPEVKQLEDALVRDRIDVERATVLMLSSLESVLGDIITENNENLIKFILQELPQIS